MNNQSIRNKWQICQLHQLKHNWGWVKGGGGSRGRGWGGGGDQEGGRGNNKLTMEWVGWLGEIRRGGGGGGQYLTMEWSSYKASKHNTILCNIIYQNKRFCIVSSENHSKQILCIIISKQQIQQENEKDKEQVVR